MRLIDADALEKDLENRWNVSDDVDFSNKEVWRALENAPTIESVKKDELIRAIQGIVYDGEDCAKLIDMVDRLLVNPGMEGGASR